MLYKNECYSGKKMINKLHSKINFCEKCSPLIPQFSTYYVIYIDYYMALFISYPLSAREPIGSSDDI